MKNFIKTISDFLKIFLPLTNNTTGVLIEKIWEDNKKEVNKLKYINITVLSYNINEVRIIYNDNITILKIDEIDDFIKYYKDNNENRI